MGRIGKAIDQSGGDYLRNVGKDAKRVGRDLKKGKVGRAGKYAAKAVAGVGLSPLSAAKAVAKEVVQGERKELKEMKARTAAQGKLTDKAEASYKKAATRALTKITGEKAIKGKNKGYKKGSDWSAASLDINKATTKKEVIKAIQKHLKNARFDDIKAVIKDQKNIE